MITRTLSGSSRAADLPTELAALTVLVMAKAPIAGQVKTRLCPPLLPHQAAMVAAAALLDTMEAVTEFGVVSRRRQDPTSIHATLALAGRLTAAPAGPAVAAALVGSDSEHRWRRIPQRGNDFTTRLVNAHADTRRADAGTAVLQIGMDTPQLTASLLADCLAVLRTPGVDAVLGVSSDGGWWALGLRDPRAARVLHQVEMSTAGTGAETLRALRAAGLWTALLPTLTDVDTIADAITVAALIPASRFAHVLRQMTPAPVTGDPR